VDDDLTRRAERATLGAMISDQHLATRLDCLEARDFTDPRHRAVFEAVRMLGGTPPLAPGGWRALIAATAGRPVTADYLDGLAAACPDPAHGPAYSAMLIQASLYRLARKRANDIDAQAALLGYEGSRITEAGGTGGSQAAGIGGHLAEVARAIRGHTAMLAPGSPDPAAGAPATGADLHAGLARAAWPFAGPLPGTPRAAAAPRPGEPATATIAERREELVLSALLQRHAQAGQILSFLPAAAFTSPARQETFRAIRRVSLSGRPVDELTVRWDLATHTATTAVVSPDTARPSQVPDGYIDTLARTAISGERSPLRVAHDLSALLQHRNFLRPQPAPATQPGQPFPAQPADGPHRVAQPGPAPAQPTSLPLNRPPHPVEPRHPGPEQRR
jgi:hypothetical protein